jgi:thiol-disulfide isomerase/thioredoxin
MVIMGSLAFSAEKGDNRDEFVVTTMTGKKIKVYGTTKGIEIPAYKGKVVMIEFWGTHCPPCLRSIPHYINLMKKYGKSVALLAIEAQDTPKTALAQFVKSKGINYDVVSYRDAGEFIDYVGQRAQWNGSIPFLIILDKKSEVVAMQIGMVPERTIEKTLKHLISKK